MQLGPAEILVILVVALIVFGPTRLPEIGRQVGRGLRELRKFQDTVRRDLDEVMPDDSMTVVEHLAELRRRLIISIVAVAAAAALCYWFAPDIIRFFLEYYKDATNGQKDAFIFTGPLDAFVTRLKVATYAGITLAVPIWLWQLWRFITPGLEQREKRYAVPFLLSSVALFALGAFVALIT